MRRNIAEKLPTLLSEVQLDGLKRTSSPISNNGDIIVEITKCFAI